MFHLIDSAERAEVYLYGRIGNGFWEEGNSAKRFCDQLAELSPKPLDIHIDSGGGDVFEAYAICAAIQRYGGTTTCYIDGLAASAASYIAVVCDEVKMNEYAWIMIHQASALTQGNADELEQMVARLRSIDATIAQIYEKRTLLTLDEITQAMSDETWYSASDALEANFCQEIIETEERMAACVDEVSAREYRNIPQAVQIGSVDILIDELPEPSENEESHAESKVVADKASYFAVDGRVFRKDEK